MKILIKTTCLSLLLFLIPNMSGQKLIDIENTDKIITHAYPNAQPAGVTILSVKEVNDKEDIEFDSYKNMQVLRIENCNLGIIEIDFNKCPLIQSIYINNCTFKDLIFHGTPSHFKKVMLYERHFENFDFLGNFTSLEEVYISDTFQMPVENLINNLLKLPNIKTVSIADGQIKRLPENIKQFKKLEWLSLNYMQKDFDLAHAFELIQNIELQYLDLMGCRGEILPPQIQLMKKIKGLGIVSTSFKSLPEEIGNLAQLEELQASMSSLDSVPLSLSKLTNLHTLGLMPCDFKTIPVVLYQMTWLKFLEIGSFEWFPSDAELKPLRKKLKGCKVNEGIN